MSKDSWKEQLARALKKTRPAKADHIVDSGANSPEAQFLRLAVVGIGNELNGDDAAGVLAARALRASLKDAPQELSDRLLFIEAGAAPENFTGPLRRFQPDLVLLVDAADFDSRPGTIAWVEWADVDGFSASTHSLPPSVFASFLIHDLGCEIAVLAIQARHLELDQPPSPDVLAAVLELAREFTGLVNLLASRS
jgi:hydrogenase 3 maturation protease